MTYLTEEEMQPEPWTRVNMPVSTLENLLRRLREPVKVTLQDDEKSMLREAITRYKELCEAVAKQLESKER